MAVANNTPVNAYIANGVSPDFNFDFQLLDLADLVVRNGVETTGNSGIYDPSAFTVTGIGSPIGGTVTLLPQWLPASGDIIIIYRRTSGVRSVDYQTNGELPAAVLNKELDRLWLAYQELRYAIEETCMRVPLGDFKGFMSEQSPKMLLPPRATRASAHPSFDSGGFLAITSPQ